MLVLPQTVIDDIVEFAISTYPYEACGLLSGPGGGDEAVRRHRTSGQAGALFGNTGLTGTQPAVGGPGHPGRHGAQGSGGYRPAHATGGFRAEPPEDPNEVTIPHGSLYRDDRR